MYGHCQGLHHLYKHLHSYHHYGYCHFHGSHRARVCVTFANVREGKGGRAWRGGTIIGLAGVAMLCLNAGL